jgi:SWI/SNF-related matrix-associated actin-dependent regulator of chromatin subfamily A-like protein 1
LKIIRDGDSLLVIGLPAPGDLPLTYVAPFRWRASYNDLPLLTQQLPEATVDTEVSVLPPPILDPPLKDVTQLGVFSLWDFQREIVYNRMVPNMLLGDEPAMGKSVQAIAYVVARGLGLNGSPSVLVICNAAARGQWKEMIEQAGEVAAIYEKGPTFPPTRFVITNYDRLDRVLRVTPHKTSCIIFDEAHLLRTPNSARTLAATELAKEARHLLFLSGTPVRHHTRDLWPVLAMIDPLAFGAVQQFLNRYCDPQRIDIPGGTVMAYDGTTHGDELTARMAPYFIARTKKQVNMQLPEKIRDVIPVGLSNRPHYNATEKELAARKKQAMAIYGGDLSRMPPAERAIFMTGVNTLRQIAADGKVDAMVEWIGERIDPLLIFTSFRAPAMRLVEELSKRPDIPEPLLLMGGVPKVHELVHKAEVEKRSIVATIQTGGESLNLQGVTGTVLFLDIEWDLTGMKQAEDRVHRPGQTAEKVLIHYFTAGTSVEDRVVKKLIEKLDASPMLEAVAPLRGILEEL